jgi:hypothetical protein
MAAIGSIWIFALLCLLSSSHFPLIPGVTGLGTEDFCTGWMPWWWADCNDLSDPDRSCNMIKDAVAQVSTNLWPLIGYNFAYEYFIYRGRECGHEDRWKRIHYHVWLSAYPAWTKIYWDCEIKLVWSTQIKVARLYWQKCKSMDRKE